jgi:hypothetical protein
VAIDTINEKLALMEEDIWEPALPISPGSLGQDDKQQLIWGYPGLLWGAAALLTFVLDLNTRLMVFLRDYYGVTGGDLTTLADQYMDAMTDGDRTERFERLIQDATDSMT